MRTFTHSKIWRKEKMTMPTKEEVVTKAMELWRHDAVRANDPSFDIKPTHAELVEDGYICTARSELMYSLKRKHAEFLNYSEGLNTHPFEINIAEAMQTTSFIGGSRGTGKTDVAMMIADQLINEDIIVLAFDPSTDWMKRSSIRYYFMVKPYSHISVPQHSTIFDLSRLTPMQQQKFVDRFCKQLFEYQLDSEKRFYLVFEEAQLFFPLNSLRSKKTQNAMRIVTVGRNVGVSVCAISQFPALIDKELIKHAQQIWIGTTSELNSLKYWRGILRKTVDTLKTLRNGQFVYYHRNKISLTEIEPYVNSTLKTEITVKMPKSIERPIKKQQHDNGKAVASIITALLWFAAILLALKVNY